MNYNSICSSCRHESSCTFINHSPNAILMCEEFEIEAVEKKEIEQALTSLLIINSSTDYTGLCINCDNRVTCQMRNNDSVKWHCEEFVAA